MNGKRDPFFSPVVQEPAGSGCSTGKKCLEIGQINLRGVVKSENGFIAVVTNNLNKAYFLRENDPVFNGYVVKITGDSVVFQETVQDKLGKADHAGSDEANLHAGGLASGDGAPGKPEPRNRVRRRTRGLGPRVGERRNAKATTENVPTAAAAGADGFSRRDAGVTGEPAKRAATGERGPGHGRHPGRDQRSRRE